MSTIAPEARVYPEGTMHLRAVETTDALSQLSGIAVPYGQETDVGFYRESFAPGALAKSIKESARALPLLLFHDDMSFPIGVASEWHEEDAGLRGVWRLDAGETAQRAAQLAKDGLLSFMSIRFVPIRSEWTYVQDWNPDAGPAGKDSVVRTEARLIETSLLSTPAYNGAAVAWVRTGERPLQRDAGTRELREWREFLTQARG
jgi:HK97 family phage prohead protease